MILIIGDFDWVSFNDSKSNTSLNDFRFVCSSLYCFCFLGWI